MRRFIFLFVLILFATVQAQILKMQIEGKPQKLDFEIVAQKDANGRFCAGIKVISDMDGFSYDAYNGVVKLDDKPGEDLVYLQPDERVLEIYHSGYGPLKIILNEIGITLKPRQVWAIKISGEQKLTQIPVVIITNPEGAHVYIDGKDKGTLEQQTVSSGTHSIRLIKQGFEPIIETIQVDEKNTLFKYTLQEIEDVPVQITSKPSGATVFIDNVKFGTTPLSDFYPSGKYPIRIEKDWFVTYDDFIEIKSPETKKNYVLREDYGSLTVTSAPQKGLDISLNGQIKNVKTPYTFNRLKPGTYRVSAKSELYEAPEQSIELKRGTKQNVDLKSHPNFGSLTVNSSPQKGLDIFLNDQKQNVKTPHTFPHLSPGTYRVSAKAKLYLVKEQSIEIKRGGQHTVNLNSDGNFAELNINTLDGARVFLNGKRISILKNLKLEPQVVRLKAEMPPKGRPKEERVVLKKGENKTVELFPEIPVGTIQVAVVPFDAKIMLKGDAGEYYTANKSKAFKNIPIGKYTLRVKKSGYKSHSEKIVLKEGQTEKRKIILNAVQRYSHRQTKKDDRVISSTGFSGIHPILKSTVVPGWGQISNGKTKGYVFLASFIGAAGWYYSAYSGHSKNMDEYNSAKNSFESNPTIDNALIVNEAVKKTDESYKQGMTALYVLGGVYVVNLLDALLFSPKKETKTYSIKPHINIYGDKVSTRQPLYGLTINW